MRPYADRLALAERHVKAGQAIIERQRRSIAERKAMGRNTAAFEELLGTFETTQALFENDLAALLNAGR